jgi:hypothetical protein
MVGQSKILEISRNSPDANTALGVGQHGKQDDGDMANALRMGEPEHFVEADTDTAPSWSSEDSADFQDDIVIHTRPWAAILAGTALAVLAIGWTGLWAWANLADLSNLAAPARIVELVGLWAVPVVLFAICWLLIMRSSASEARRFADVAALLRSESEALEQRMRTVNGEISLARSFLAENARELESIGRASATKLTDVAETLVTALSDTDQKAQLLERVSSAAVNNVELLRNHLPVVTSAAKDATNQIGNAGIAANEQVQALSALMRSMNEDAIATSASMDALGQQAQASRDLIETVAGEAASTLNNATIDSETRMAAMLETLKKETAAVESRLGEVAENVSALTTSNSKVLDDQTAKIEGAVAAIGEAAQTQDTQIAAMIGRFNAALADSNTQLTAADSEAEARLRKLTSGLSDILEKCDQRLTTIDSNATDRIAKIAFAINALSESSSELAVNLAGNEERAAMMLADAEKLLKELGAVSDELSDKLPPKFARMEQQFATSNDALVQLRDESGALDLQSTALIERFSEIETLLKSQRTIFEKLAQESDATLSAKQAEIDALAASLNATHALIVDVSATAEEQLSGPLQRVADAAEQAATNSRALVETELADVSAKLASQSQRAIKQAIDAQLGTLDETVQQAINRNLSLSDEAAARVNRQLQSISELTANLEQRAAAARAGFDGIDDEAFARRIALLTESLNSAAIDVAKILSNEVTDTAWAAYLKGDRGVFTRRAVRLLDSGEARIIANHYDDDPEFRDHVNRYIHDFEAMMRVLLSTRDGNAIGVTLLSSDVGKLYVALAQAIDRLRG